MKYGDVVGDKEIPLTEEQYAFHGLLSIILMIICGTYACFVNLEILCMMTGCYIGCYFAGKLDIPEHLIPGIVFMTMPVFPYVLQSAPWNGLDFTGPWKMKIMTIAGHVTFVTFLDEFLHELFKDHPNYYVQFFFDTRLTSDLITVTMLYLNAKNKLPNGFNNLVRWEYLFFCPVCFGSGYEFSREAANQIDKFFLS